MHHKSIEQVTVVPVNILCFFVLPTHCLPADNFYFTTSFFCIASVPCSRYHFCISLVMRTTSMISCGEFVEKSERFLLAVDRMNGLDALIVVSPDGPELFVKFGQADEKIVRVAVAHRDAKRSVEEACTDKIRRTAVLCLPHHRQESFVFLVVELQVVPVCLWVGQHFASGGISVRASHRHIISCSRFDLEEPFAVQSFCAALSGGRKYPLLLACANKTGRRAG